MCIQHRIVTHCQSCQISAINRFLWFQPLEEAIKSALRSDFEDVVLALLMAPTQYDAYELKHAMKVNVVL